MLESVFSWLTPTALFLLLNLVIGTIAFTSYRSSSSSSSSSSADPSAAGGAYLFSASKLSRTPSPSMLLDSLKSFISYPSSSSSSADPSAAGGTHLFSASKLSRSPSILLDRLKSCKLLSSSSSSSSSSSDPADTNTETIQNSTVQIPKLEQCEGEPEPKPVTKPEAQPEQGQRIVRSQSDMQPVAGEMPKKLAKKLKKSATLKSAFIHFEPAEELESSPPKRPATMREREQEKEEAEVDERADDFINRFRQQLKLQRVDSFLRYKDMLGRGN